MFTIHKHEIICYFDCNTAITSKGKLQFIQYVSKYLRHTVGLIILLFSCEMILFVPLRFSCYLIGMSVITVSLTILSKALIIVLKVQISV